MVDVADDADRAALISALFAMPELLGGGRRLRSAVGAVCLCHIGLQADRCAAVDVVDASR